MACRSAGPRPMPNVSPRIAAAIGDGMDAKALISEAQALSVRATAELRVAQLELTKAGREARIAASLEHQAQERVEIARRKVNEALINEERAAERIASACRRFSGIDHQVSPAVRAG